MVMELVIIIKDVLVVVLDEGLDEGLVVVDGKLIVVVEGHWLFWSTGI